MSQFDDLFGFEETQEQDDKYTAKVGVPQYLPKVECPKLWECYDVKKYNELIKNINHVFFSKRVSNSFHAITVSASVLMAIAPTQTSTAKKSGMQ